MSRPMALGLVLLVLILTSQSDWKQDTRTELEENASTATKQEDVFTSRDSVTQQVILMQEKEIYELKLRVKRLEEKLKECECEAPPDTNSKVVTETAKSSAGQWNELEDPVPERATKLRGSVRPSSLSSYHPSESPDAVLEDALDLTDDENVRIGDR